MACPSCGADVRTHYCQACGAAVGTAGTVGAATAAERPSSPEPRGSAPQPAEPDGLVGPALLACPACGAPNAASRASCGHCGGSFGPDDPEATGEMAAVRPPPARATHPVAPPVPARPGTGDAVERGPVRALVVVSVIAAAGAVVLALALLGARGVGPFATSSTEVLADAEVVAVAGVLASSAAQDADNAVDGDAGTAWVPAEESRPWIELELAEAAEVDGVALWPAEGRRPATVRLATDEHAFHAALLDLDGPVIIELPEAVPASRVRVELLAGHGTDRPGLAGVEVRQSPR